MRAVRIELRGRAAGWRVLPAVVVAVVSVVIVVTGITAVGADSVARGSASHGGSGSSGATGPSMVRARSVAAEEFGLLSGGGWAQAWSLWSAAGQAALSEADFVRLNTECRPVLGEPYVVDSATDVDATDVRVAWHQGSTTGSSSVVFEGGAWRIQPDAQTLAGYRTGVTALVAERKAAGRCH